MCDTPKCLRPARYWIQTNLPRNAPLTVPNTTVGLCDPNRNLAACGKHLPGAVRSLHAYTTEYLAGPGAVVAYRWAGLVVKMRNEGVWR